jgi:hypothetical protein
MNWDVHPGSRIRMFPSSRIPDPDPGVKKHRIPDLDPQHWSYLLYSWMTTYPSLTSRLRNHGLAIFLTFLQLVISLYITLIP